MRRFLALVCAALLGASVATGLATRCLPMVARPVPPPSPDLYSGARPAGVTPFEAQSRWAEGREQGEVLFGSTVVLRIRSQRGGLSPYERALIAAARINRIATSDHPAPPLRTVPTKGGVCVAAGPETIVVADDETALGAGTTAARLAEEWLARVQECLASSTGPAAPADGTAGAAIGATGLLGRPAAAWAMSLALVPPPVRATAAFGALAFALAAGDDRDDHSEGSRDGGSPRAETPKVWFRARENHPEGREEGEVVVGQTTVFRIRSPYHDLSAYERALIAAKRLNDFVEDYGTGGTLRVVVEGAETYILGGSIKIAVIDPQTAALNGEETGPLADKWLANIKAVLGSPPGERPPAHSGDPALPPPGDPVNGAGAVRPIVLPPSVKLGGGKRVPILGASPEHKEIGTAEIAGDGADRCVGVLALETPLESCGVARALVCVAKVPDGSAPPARLGGCSVTGFAFREPPSFPVTDPSAARARQGFSMSEVLKVAGARECVRWFASDLDARCTALAGGVPVSRGWTTAVLPAVDCAVRKTTGGVQIAAPTEVASRARAALLAPESGAAANGFRYVVVSSSNDPDDPTVVAGLGALAVFWFAPSPADEGVRGD